MRIIKRKLLLLVLVQTIGYAMAEMKIKTTNLVKSRFTYFSNWLFIFKLDGSAALLTQSGLPSCGSRSKILIEEQLQSCVIMGGGGQKQFGAGSV